MLDVQNFDSRPMRTGDSRKFVVHGDGPFLVSSRCFVDKPRPPGPGFLPCPECTEKTVNPGQAVTINSSPDLWRMREGYVEITISNSIGESQEFRIVVLPDSDSNPTAMAHG